MKRRSFFTPKWIAIGVAAALMLTGSLYGFHMLEQFLIRDPRFAFHQAADGADSLEVTGAPHVSKHAIRSVFADDFGRSAYLIPLSDRRETLRSVDWVKDASVARFWPNRVVVGMTERKPVAFLGSKSETSDLIDDEGVILPPVAEHFPLPVLAGVRESSSLAQRRESAQRLLSLMKDLGDASHAVAQVDVSDTDDIKVMEPFEGRMVTLLLGDRDFALRHQNFTRYYAEIVKKMPEATVLDLRVEDRITVVPQSKAVNQ